MKNQVAVQIRKDIEVIALHVAKESEYFTDTDARAEYPDFLSMIQDSMQGEAENWEDDPNCPYTEQELNIAINFITNAIQA